MDDPRDRALRSKLLDGRLDGRGRAPIDRLIGAADGTDRDIGRLKQRRRATAATPVPSSVITTRPPGMRPRRSIGSGASIASRTRRCAGSCGLPFECVDRPDEAGEIRRLRESSAVCLLGQARHPVDDHAQGAGSGQSVHRLGGIREALQYRKFIAHFAEDLDSLDGIDSQVGFHIQVEAERLDRITCPIAHGFEQP